MKRKSAPDPFDLSMPLKAAELRELDRFLVSDATSDTTLTLSGLDGYQTALVIGPTTLVPSRWLPGVWGGTDDAAPEFESIAQAERIMGMLLRHMNSIVADFEADPESFDPLFETLTHAGRDYLCGEAWANGFMQGVELVRTDWQPLYDRADMVEVIRPLHLLGSEQLITNEEEELTATPKQREELALNIPSALAEIHAFWLPYRTMPYSTPAPAKTAYRREAKVGRNDPCPCGSGVKFKKCCGTMATRH